MMSGKVKGSAREHKSRAYWMQAVQNRPNSAGRLTGAVKFTANVPHADTHDYFANILRRNIGPGNSGTGTLDLRTARPEDVPFLSTNSYLREQFGVTPSQPSPKPSDIKMPPGTPFYKTPEEYYDEVLDLRKQVTGFLAENSVLKAKQRRLEDELIRRDKELVQAFEKQVEKGDSGKTSEPSSGRTDKATMVQNLKLRLFKLEQKYKIRDSEYRRLEADVKKTDTDELRHQLDICLGQIATLRYHNAKILSGQVSDRSAEVVQEVVPAKAVEEFEPYSDETDSFSSDSETGYKGHKSRSASHSRSASRLSLQRVDSAKQRAVVSIASVEPSPPTPVVIVKEERPQSSDRPRCNLKEHQRFEDLSKELSDLHDALNELERRREAMEKGNGQVRSSQKLVLKGTASERLLALDTRENDLLERLNAVTKENEEMKEKMKHLEAGLATMKDRTEADTAAELQSLLRAHQVRVTDKEQILSEVSRVHEHHLQQNFFEDLVDEPPESTYIVNLQSIMRAHMERRATVERSVEH